ncbi:MAG TPA: anti-sigma factor [Candidatus Limnocylindrales bacterium]|nr:anti-sigma factor [Candidatus Limnocylindrales bacterium]
MNERMDHAAAHEQIGDLLLEPARLAALQVSTQPDDVALREHLAGCAACAADLESWRRLQVAVDAALPAEATPAARASAVEPIAVPPSLRASVLAAIADTDRGAPIDPDAPNEPDASNPIPIARARRRARLAPVLGLAASFVILAGSAFVTIGQLDRRAAAEADAQELTAAIAVVDRMLASDHKVVRLETTSGAAAGTISWSRHDWVVLTNALAEPPSGQEYLCWLETDGRNVPIGRMDFAGDTAYWVASLDEWQTWEIGPTTRFVVTLEAAGAEQRAGPAILDALLSS